MGNIIHLHGDPHEQTQQLLPWLVNGTLEGAERRMVDEHLTSCAECRADLAREEKLAALLVSAPADEPDGWAALRNRAVSGRMHQQPPRWMPLTRSGRIAAIAASQLLLIGASIGAYQLLSQQPTQPAYRALGAAGGTVQGNVIVIFRADMTEQAMRGLLQKTGARIVNGPTSAGAYVLAVPPAQRDGALDALRQRPDIVMAQPIEGSALP